MNIILVTTSFNDEVHGTFNDKRTGCGINLLKPDNASRFRLGGKMTDLGELTCEKCKARIAKEMIKSDQKEMKAILKEERLRVKKGIADEGIVPLGNTTAKITSAQNVPQSKPAPEPVQEAPVQPQVQPEPPKPAYQPNGAPVLNDDLAQFAINKPIEQQELQEDSHIPEQAKQPNTQPAQDSSQIDDFLAQFAIQKPDEDEPEETVNNESDFLAQFAVSDNSTKTSQPVEAVTAPLPENVSAPVEYEEQNEYIPENNTEIAEIAEITPEDDATDTLFDDIDDIDEVEEAPYEAEDYTENERRSYENDWNILANQLFSGMPNAVQASIPSLDEIKLSSDYTSHSSYDDDDDSVRTEAPTLDDIRDYAQKTVQAVSENTSHNAAEAPQLTPVLEDISADDVTDEPMIASAKVEKAPELVLEDIREDDDDKDFELISPDLEAKSPVLDDITDAISAMNIPTAQPAVAPAPTPVPVIHPSAQIPLVIDDISAALSALNTQPAPINQPVPVQPAAMGVRPAGVPVRNDRVPVQPVQQIHSAIAPNPAAPVGVVGQVISVPQITGYDSLNQPVYTYIQMQIQGYDQNGQPVLVPLPDQNITFQNATTFRQRYNQNTRLRDAIAAAKVIPTSTKDMTPGQRIAAANAAKGDPVSANVSKIATNQHTKSTSQAFISAISESKEYANQSLTETQGLQQRTSVLNSVEDVLSQLGDNSLKEKKIAEVKAQRNFPTYQEYKMPVKPAVSYAAPPTPPPAPKPAQVDERMLSKSELRAKKKQEKIDAKFQRDMAKRK